jgi:hypothetical protein
MTPAEPPEPAEAMLARVRASIERQAMMTTLGMTALYDRPGISG